MKSFTYRRAPKSASTASVIEGIEQIRTTLRWNQHLPDDDKADLLRRLKQLREQFFDVSHQRQVSPRPGEVDMDTPVEALPLGGKPKKDKAPQGPSIEQRREALLADDFAFDGVLGDSPALIETLEICRRAAATRFPVLIEGESGTGKELIARVVHNNSPRAEQPFVSVNCGAIPASLIESELFGHKKGAFTGAVSDRKGLFESANQGSVFLDEIGELSLDGQVKLLRVLQQGEVQPVGSTALTPVDIRVVAATHQNLRKMVADGEFREDLYYRLGVIQVRVPPLRERRDEMGVLLDYYLLEAADQLGREPPHLHPQVLAFFETHRWPGNIRELQNVVYRLSLLADEEATIAHLPDHLREQCGTADAALDHSPTAKNLAQIKKAASHAAEKRFLIQGLRQVNGNVTRLSEQLDMSRTYLQRLLRQHALRSGDYKKNKEN